MTATTRQRLPRIHRWTGLNLDLLLLFMTLSGNRSRRFAEPTSCVLRPVQNELNHCRGSAYGKEAARADRSRH